MKVISIGREYQIYDDSMQTHQKLPPQTYYLRFSKFKGFYLEAHGTPVIKEDKIYGVHNEKVDKVLKGFKRTNKNFGVILSGNKGIGKSLFAKLLSKTAIEKGYPVIIINECYAGISSVLEDIEQEVVVLFDEFDKTFGSDNDDKSNPQDMLLSLFDGLSNGKKLFVVTCNVLQNLSNYLVNRPGRFHYHFRFDYPSLAEIDEYMKDKLDEKFYPEIEKVKTFATKVDLNYDCLCAIAFELNTGIPFEEAIKDLNIINIDTERYNLTLILTDGRKLTARRIVLDMFDKSEVECTEMYDTTGINIIDITFNPGDFDYDWKTGTNTINGDNIKIEISPYYEESDIAKKYADAKPKCLIAERCKDKNLHYLV